MTIEQRVDELMAHGAAMRAYPPGQPPLTVLLAALAWRYAPKRVRWCALYPVHQGHIHELDYTTARMAAGGRDVALLGPGKEMVAYITPFEESGLDEAESKDAFVAWRNEHDEKVFQRFFNEA